jgi:hypothetical protein
MTSAQVEAVIALDAKMKDRVVEVNTLIHDFDQSYGNTLRDVNNEMRVIMTDFHRLAESTLNQPSVWGFLEKNRLGHWKTSIEGELGQLILCSEIDTQPGELTMGMDDLLYMSDEDVCNLPSPPDTSTAAAKLQRKKLLCRLKELQISAGMDVVVEKEERVRDDRKLWEILVGRLTQLTCQIDALSHQANGLFSKISALDKEMGSFKQILKTKHEKNKNSMLRTTLKVLGSVTAVTGAVLAILGSCGVLAPVIVGAYGAFGSIVAVSGAAPLVFYYSADREMTTLEDTCEKICGWVSIADPLVAIADPLVSIADP